MSTSMRTEDLKEQGRDIKEKASDFMHEAKEKAVDQFDRVERMIRRNPMAAVGVAAGVGFMLALLARR